MVHFHLGAFTFLVVIDISFALRQLEFVIVVAEMFKDQLLAQGFAENRLDGFRLGEIEIAYAKTDTVGCEVPRFPLCTTT